MNQMKTIIAILIWVIFLTGCSGTHPFIMSVTAQPGYPGEQHDLFPCAAHRLDGPNFRADEISWDTNAGAFQNNAISTTYGTGQFSGPIMSGNQRNGWFIDDAGYAYFAHVTRTNTIEVYQSTVGPYILGTWALWAADATQTWENIDFSGFDDNLFGLAYDSAGTWLYGMWLDTNTPPLIFTTQPLAFTFGLDTYSCTRYGDNLYGALHYIWQISPLTKYYSFLEPPVTLEHSTPDALPFPVASWEDCQIVGDFEERLWVFYHDIVPIYYETAHNTLENTTWLNSPNLVPFTTPALHAWKFATRYTDDTIHAVAIYQVVDGADWDYQVWYTRRSKSGWLAPVMVDNWAVAAADEAAQSERLSVQITSAPSGIMLWTIQYDTILNIGDVNGHFLSPAFYHDPTTGPWINYPDADGTNFDYLELNAPKWWPI